MSHCFSGFCVRNNNVPYDWIEADCESYHDHTEDTQLALWGTYILSEDRGNQRLCYRYCSAFYSQ